MATFSWTVDYDPDDHGTLIFQRETGTVSISYWGTPSSVPLHSADRVRAKYSGQVIFLGIVERTTTEYVVDEEAKAHGATHRVNFSASCVGKYSAALERTVCYDPPAAGTTAHDFITQWIAVLNW